MPGSLLPTGNSLPVQKGFMSRSIGVGVGIGSGVEKSCAIRTEFRKVADLEADPDTDTDPD